MGPLSGATDAYGYNGRNEVVSARRTLGGSPVAGFDEDFAYDPIGNRVSSTDYDETGAARTSTYTANNLNQYTSRTVPGWASVRGLADADATVAVNGNLAYALAADDIAYFFGSDDFDNSVAGGFAELEVSATMSDGTNDFVSVATNRVFVPPANETYAYDADGNQTLVTTGTGAWQVEYNGENRPVRWTRVSPDSSTPNSSTPTLVSMTYDHQGRRRLYVEVTSGVTNKLHRFTYDGYVCIERKREVDTALGCGSDDFVWDPTEPIATRSLMCAPSTETPFFYCHDGNKNVSEAVTPDGSIAAHYEYSSFGKVVLVTSENVDQSVGYFNPYRFSSEYADDALGLVYYNYRHYEPMIGRWLSRDLVSTLNIYTFCVAPLSEVDVLGSVVYANGWDSASFAAWYWVGKGESVDLSYWTKLLDFRADIEDSLSALALSAVTGAIPPCTKEGHVSASMAPFETDGVFRIKDRAGKWWEAIYDSHKVLNEGGLHIKFDCSIEMDCKCCGSKNTIEMGAGMVSCKLDVKLTDRFANPTDKVGPHADNYEARKKCIENCRSNSKDGDVDKCMKSCPPSTDLPGAVPYNISATWQENRTYTIKGKACK